MSAAPFPLPPRPHRGSTGARAPRPGTTARAPRAGIDVIGSADDALAVLLLARHQPPMAETLAFFLDDRRCGVGTVVSITDTVSPDDVVEVVELLCRAAFERVCDGSVSGLVVASSRRGGGLLPDDARRWCTLSDLAESHGIALVEWLVLGPDGPVFPREVAGEPARWDGW